MYTGYQGDIFQGHFSGVSPFFNVTYQGTIKAGGGIALSTILNTASTLTLTNANKNVIANAAGGAQTLTLPSCYTAWPDKATPTGLELTVIKSDTSSNAVTLETVSSQNINYAGTSATTLALSAAGKRTLVCGPDYNWYAF
jgi:type 1 fimbria pilin